MSKAKSYIFAIIVILIAWQIISLIAGQIVVASPISVATRLVSEAQTLNFWTHLQASLLRILAALVLSFITAVPLGLVLGNSPRLDKYFRPFIYLTYPVPKVVLMPVVMLIFGIGDLSKIIVLWMILFFQLLITARDSAGSISQAAKYSLQSLGGGRFDLIKHVIWPSCLPSILTALRISTGTVVAVLFLVESIGTNWGLGYYVIDAWGRADISQIFVGLVVMAGIGFILYEIFDFIENKHCAWAKM